MTLPAARGLEGLFAASLLLLLAGSASAQAPGSTPYAGGAAPPALAAPPPAAPPPEPVATSPAPAVVVPAADPETPASPPPRGVRREPAPETTAPVRSRVLFMPMLGFHSFRNDDATNLGAGLRLGALLGGRVNESLSFNVDATLDLVNPNNVPSGVDVTALQFHIAFAPLAHLAFGGVEFVAGPKIGLFALSLEASEGGQTASSSAHGWLYGFNLGLFGALNEAVSMGGFLSFDIENATEVCLTDPGQAEMCSSDNLGDSAKVLSMGIALLL